MELQNVSTKRLEDEFNAISDSDWERELKRARNTPNTIRQQIRQLTDKQSIISNMSNISKYLPERSEYSEKIVKVLKSYENKLYVVGSNARKTLYGLKTDVKDYDFIWSDEPQYGAQIVHDLMEAANGKAKSTDWGTEVDAETFNLKLKCQPIDQFLFSVRFAGDGVAVKVSDGRPLVLPEYMSLPPVVQIIPDEQVGDQKGEWLERHLKVLEDFQTELFNSVQSKLDEPLKSTPAS